MGRPPVKIILEPGTRELFEHVYKTSTCCKDRQKAHVALLAQDGTRSYEQLADIVGRCRATVFNWLKTLALHGPETLLGEAPRPGRPTRMNQPVVLDALQKGLEEGRWVTSAQARAWLEKEFGIRISARRMRYWLGKLEGAHKVPRPVHTKKDTAAAADFRGHLYDKLCALDLPEGARVRVWALDEARYGLHDKLRRCWGLRVRRAPGQAAAAGLRMGVCLWGGGRGVRGERISHPSLGES